MDKNIKEFDNVEFRSQNGKIVIRKDCFVFCSIKNISMSFDKVLMAKPFAPDLINVQKDISFGCRIAFNGKQTQNGHKKRFIDFLFKTSCDRDGFIKSVIELRDDLLMSKSAPLTKSTLDVEEKKTPNKNLEIIKIIPEKVTKRIISPKKEEKLLFLSKNDKKRKILNDHFVGDKPLKVFAPNDPIDYIKNDPQNREILKRFAFCKFPIVFEAFEKMVLKDKTLNEETFWNEFAESKMYKLNNPSLNYEERNSILHSFNSNSLFSEEKIAELKKTLGKEVPNVDESVDFTLNDHLKPFANKMFFVNDEQKFRYRKQIEKLKAINRNSISYVRSCIGKPLRLQRNELWDNSEDYKIDLESVYLQEEDETRYVHIMDREFEVKNKLI